MQSIELPNYPMSSSSLSPAPYFNRQSFKTLYNPSTSDLLGDIASGILPGIIFAITFLLNSKYVYPKNEKEGRIEHRRENIKKLIMSIIPVTLVLTWYLIKKFKFGRSSKIGNLSWIIIGNAISFGLIIIIGIIVLTINN